MLLVYFDGKRLLENVETRAYEQPWLSSYGCLRLKLSDTAGSRFRVGDTKGRIWASTGKSTFKMVTVSLIWSVHMVHSISVAAQDRLRGDQDGGTC